MTHSTAVSPRRAAFTLIELLVVVGIIGILMAVTFSIGPRVFQGQRIAATRNTLVALDRMLDEYVDANGVIPPYDTDDYYGVPGAELSEEPDSPTTGPEEIADVGEHVRFPPASVFVHQAKGAGAADNILAGLPPRFIVTTQRVSQLAGGPSDPGADTPPEPFMPNILDVWAVSDTWDPPWPQLGTTLILYVHPRNILAQQLYGRCVNGRPYFMSAGPDRLYGATAQVFPRQGTSSDLGDTDPSLLTAALKALKDNIYSYQPEPADTAPTSSFNTQYR